MITQDELSRLIRSEIPDADVQTYDWTGTLDHYRVTVASDRFAGMPIIERNRLIYAAVGEALKDGRLHALEIRTAVPTPPSKGT